MSTLTLHSLCTHSALTLRSLCAHSALSVRRGVRAGYAAFLSTILRTGSQVIGVCLFFFMFNYLFDSVIAFVLYSSLLPRWARNLLSVCFPPFLYALGFTDLYDALGANGKGMKWEEIDDNGVTCDTYCARVCQCDYTPEEEDPVNGKPYVIYPLSETMEWCAVT